MRTLSLLALVLGQLVLGLLLVGGAAWAEPPSRLGGPVTDTAGVLAPGDDARIGEAFDRLRAADGVQVFVTYVESFDGADGQDWADDAARLSQLGDEDVLFAVAVSDRAFGFSVAQESSLSDGDLSRAESAAEERLAQDNWAGAAIALADALGGGGGGGVGIGAAVVGGVALIGGGAYLLARRRRVAAPRTTTDAAPRDEFTDVPTDDLAYRASADLIEVDEAVRTSEVELAAARGHFGEEAVAGFTAAVAASRADMLRAFGIRQQLDEIDGGPGSDGAPGSDGHDGEPARRAMFADIIRACRAADERLDAQVAAFDRLRDLEAKAPEYLAGLGTRRDAVATRLPQVEAGWTALQARYAPSAVEPVAQNVPQARRLLESAGTELTAAAGELDGGRRAEAVVSGRAAEDAITQAETLLDGVPRREAELVDAAATLPAARAETEQDLAEAGALRTLDPVVARAGAALSAARDVEASDPIAALRLIDDAEAALDDAIGQERERDRHTTAVLQQTLLTARSSVSAAADFVTTRRGAVGGQARTRLAEAQRHLQLASAGGDPAAALREAQQADVLAQEALRLAQADTSNWSAPASSNIGVDLGSLILGGIISGATRGGSGGGGFGGGGGGGRRSPGSFGGSSSRGRRGGGGRF